MCFSYVCFVRVGLSLFSSSWCQGFTASCDCFYFYLFFSKFGLKLKVNLRLTQYITKRRGLSVCFDNLSGISTREIKKFTRSGFSTLAH